MRYAHHILCLPDVVQTDEDDVEGAYQDEPIANAEWVEKI